MKRSLPHPLLAAIAACVFPLVAPAQTPDAASSQGDQTPLKWFKLDRELPCHVGQYPQVKPAWLPVDTIHDANAVYPHPLLPQRVLLATNSGLQLSEDSGRTWNALPEATTQKIGPVTSISFPTDHPDTFYIASKSRGVWMTADAGHTFKQIGSKANGMAGDSARSIEIHRGDPAGRTLLVCHGDTAGGLSRSVDGGQTWEVLHKDFDFYRTFTAAVVTDGVFFVAAKSSDPEAQVLYSTPSLGEPWQEIYRDVIVTDFCTPLMGQDAILVSTIDRGILRVSRDGGVVKNIAPENGNNWSSIGVTWGPTADSQVIYAFDPTRLGLVMWSDSPSAATSEASDLTKGDPTDNRSTALQRGLPLTAIVREGAHVRANAGGTVYYACINSMLFRGEQNSGQRITDLTVRPALRSFNAVADKEAQAAVQEGLATFLQDRDTRHAADDLLTALKEEDAAASQRRLAITARVEAGSEKPKWVSVDLSRLGGSARYPLFDDGKHADGAANDGVYGNTYAVNLLRLQKLRDWRKPWPGELGLTASAAMPSGSLLGAVAPVAIVNASEGQPLWADAGWMYSVVEQGKISSGGRMSIARNGHRFMAFTVDVPGPWRIRLETTHRKLDISSFTALAITIATKEASTDDVFVQLRDRPVYAIPTISNAAGLIKDSLLPDSKFEPTFQRAVIPLKSMIEGVDGFAATSVGSVVLSGTASRPTQYLIDEILFTTPQDAEPQGETAPAAEVPQ